MSDDAPVTAPGPATTDAGGRRRAGGTLFVAGDPLRALGALGVIGFHAYYTALQATQLHDPASLPARPLDDLGARVVANFQASVYVFFILSGYLLSRPFLAAVIDGAPLPAVGRYLRNRALRIVPGLIVATGLTALVFGLGGAHLADVVAVIGFAQIYHDSPFAEHILQAWTLDVEAVFYLCLPLAAVLGLRLLRRLATRRDRAAVVLGALGVLTVASLVWRARPATISGDHVNYLPATVCGLTPGIALAVIERLDPAARLRHREGGLLGAGMLAAAFGLWAVAVAIPYPDHLVHDTVAVTAATLLVTAPLVWQWSGRGSWRWLDNRPLHWLGQRTFSFYLVHVLMLQVILDLVVLHTGLGVQFAVFAVLGVAASALAAGIGYRLVEEPFLRRRAPWRPGSGAPAATAAPRASDPAEPAGQPAAVSRG